MVLTNLLKTFAIDTYRFLISIAGCKKFLDEKPVSQVDEIFVFSDIANTTRAIAGVYSQLTRD